MAGKIHSNIKKEVKLVVIGDTKVGKTRLLFRFADDQYDEIWYPKVWLPKIQTFKIENSVIDLNLWDTASQEEYYKVRPLAYPGSDVFLLCFALNSPASLENIRTKWWPEVQQYEPNTPILIVGTMLDLMSSTSDIQIMKDYEDINKKAKEFALKIKAIGYIECSALDRTNIAQTFQIAVQSVYLQKTLTNKKRRKGVCHIS